MATPWDYSAIKMSSPEGASGPVFLQFMCASSWRMDCGRHPKESFSTFQGYDFGGAFPGRRLLALG
jgi:hypothetical protein